METANVRSTRMSYPCADVALPPLDGQVVPQYIVRRDLDESRRHVLWNMMTERLASHMCGDLVIELDERRVHQGKLLNVILVNFDLQVHARQFLAKMIDRVNLERRISYNPSRRWSYETEIAVVC